MFEGVDIGDAFLFHNSQQLFAFRQVKQDFQFSNLAIDLQYSIAYSFTYFLLP